MEHAARQPHGGFGLERCVSLASLCQLRLALLSLRIYDDELIEARPWPMCSRTQASTHAQSEGERAGAKSNGNSGASERGAGRLVCSRTY
jgi:hypothetical protein